MTTQKLLLAGVIAALALTACDKKPAEQADNAPKAEAVTATENQAGEENKAAQTHDKHDDHDDHKEHDHDHDDHKDHDHSHDGHNHAHEGDAYKCGDKTVNIVVHNHEGEIEAHLTIDDITYDLNQDPSNTKRFTTDDGIEGENKGMALTLENNKATVTGAENKTLLECNKAS